MTPSVGRTVHYWPFLLGREPEEPLPAIITAVRFNPAKAEAIKRDPKDLYSQHDAYRAVLDERCYDVNLQVLYDPTVPGCFDIDDGFRERVTFTGSWLGSSRPKGACWSWPARV